MCIAPAACWAFWASWTAPGLLNREVKNVLGLTLPQTLEQYDVMVTQDDAVKKMFRAGPAGIRTTQAFSQDCRWDTWMTIAPKAVSVLWNTLTARTAAWRCCTAISQKTVVS
ncbi:dihydroxy-acid dehydratase [Klebsiella pneumoniae]|uniref:Dihydroxy-acid dehydratase n=1 Tax=Klebsiella pneumoniae TaxID=573 RepID=A0A2X3I9A3_KLEPN|nr:dihydroxy-acid dehydratase [Klebsiella pneumoniae]